jgi:glycosyltransferase involved in cell wall biosynthesis/VanZ family protein
MRIFARLVLLLLLAAGLWLALKPVQEEGRLTFLLPIHWSEYVDLMDFWFNLAAFAILSFVAWLAFQPRRMSLTAGFLCALIIVAVITCGNVAIECAQSRIPGRDMNIADVGAGWLGSLIALSACFWWRSKPLPMGDLGASPPKVLFLDQTGQLGGAELMLLDIVSGRVAKSEVILFQDGEFRIALEKIGVKTHLVSLSEGASAISKQSGLLSILKSIPRLLVMVLRIADQARRFDVIYANTAKALIIGGPAAFLARRPLVFHLHDIISDVHFSALNRWVLITTSNLCASSVIANSLATQSAFVVRGGNAGRCIVIPNGFDLIRPSATSADARSLRIDLHVPDNAWVILMAGRLAFWKGQHVLLEALKQVPQAHVILLGDALFTEEDRAYAQQLRVTASERSLAGRVHFAGFHKQTAPFFALADAVVHASVYAEPFGRVIVEGMLAGKPVIATRAGGAAEILSHEQTGLLIESNNASVLSQALLRLKDNPEFAKRLASAAKDHARKTYCLITVQSQIESLIRLVATPAALNAGKTSISEAPLTPRSAASL